MPGEEQVIGGLTTRTTWKFRCDVRNGQRPNGHHWSVSECRSTRGRVAAVLDGLGADVEVIGSSSVLALLAKPIIDLAVGLDTTQSIAAVTQQGWSPTDGSIWVTPATTADTYSYWKPDRGIESPTCTSSNTTEPNGETTCNFETCCAKPTTLGDASRPPTQPGRARQRPARLTTGKSDVVHAFLRELG